MLTIFQLCRKNKWKDVLEIVRSNPELALHPIPMDNHIVTSILHQAITSKGKTEQREAVILEILERTPQAATMKNGYGSLPLHVVSQRNTKMAAKIKERVIRKLVECHKDAMTVAGGVGGRTPLHVIFTGKLFRAPLIVSC